jgi:7,8-dihydroneopterin aldolase/epimerase/oxygenase
MSMSIQEIRIEDIRIAADIGIYAHEIGRAQGIVVSVRLRLLPIENDRIEDTVDYNLIVSYALTLGNERIELIETFARRLAELCLTHERILMAEISVCKSSAMTNGVPSARVVLGRKE